MMNKTIVNKAARAAALCLLLAALLALATPALAAGADTGLYLKSVDSPFHVGTPTQDLTLNEGDNHALEGDIEHLGEGDVTYAWEVSTDGGKTWAALEGDGQSFLIEDARPGEYTYRLTATDAHGNSASMEWHVTVLPLAEAAGGGEDATDAPPASVFPKTGDVPWAVPILLLFATAALAAVGIAHRIDKKGSRKCPGAAKGGMLSFLAAAALIGALAAPGTALAAESGVTADAQLTVACAGNGALIVPEATIENHTAGPVVITGAKAPDGYAWTCDAVGKEVPAGGSLKAAWTATDPVPTDIAEQAAQGKLHIGDFEYSWSMVELAGGVTVTGGENVGDELFATVAGVQGDADLGYQWMRDGVAIPDATGSTYTATDDDAGCMLSCEVTASNYKGALASNAVGPVVAPEAFAVYSADDGSLTFYKRTEIPAVGEIYGGKNVTAVFTGFETAEYASWDEVPWSFTHSGSSGGNRALFTHIYSVCVADPIQPISTAFWFYGQPITSMDLAKLDTSRVTDMSWMFYNCYSLAELDLSSWNTSSVADMRRMFASCTSLESLDLSSFDTSGVSNMASMFDYCNSLATLDISSFDTSNVTNMANMFAGMSRLQEITLGDKFSFNGYECTLPTPSAAYIDGADGRWYDEDGNGHTPDEMQAWGAMGAGHAGTYTAVAPVKPEAFAVYSDDDQSLTFYKRSDMPAAGDLYEDKVATEVYTGFETSEYGSPEEVPWYAFLGGTGGEGEGTGAMFARTVCVADVIQPVCTAYWFYGMSSCTSMDLSKLDTSNVVYMEYMFSYCSSLESLDVSHFDTSESESMFNMFYGCSSLESLDLGGWDTSNVIDMSGMFSYCSSLTSLDLSSFDTSNAANMIGMFSNMPSLREATLGEMFSFQGSPHSGSIYSALLPTPSAAYIDGADGNWYDESGNGHTPEEMQAWGAMGSEHASTYTAVAPAAVEYTVTATRTDSGVRVDISPMPSGNVLYRWQGADYGIPSTDRDKDFYDLTRDSDSANVVFSGFDTSELTIEQIQDYDWTPQISFYRCIVTINGVEYKSNEADGWGHIPLHTAFNGTATLNPDCTVSGDGCQINASWSYSPADAVPAIAKWEVADDADGTNAAELPVEDNVVQRPIWGKYLRITLEDSSGKHEGQIVSGWAGPITTPFWGTVKLTGDVKPDARPGITMHGPILEEGQTDLSNYEVTWWVADDADGTDAKLYDALNDGGYISSSDVGKYVRVEVSAKAPYSQHVTGSITSDWYQIMSHSGGNIN